MTTQVIRWKCDICGYVFKSVWGAVLCEQEDAIALETRKGGDAKQGSVEDDSAAIAQGDAS